MSESKWVISGGVRYPVDPLDDFWQSPAFWEDPDYEEYKAVPPTKKGDPITFVKRTDDGPQKQTKKT